MYIFVDSSVSKSVFIYVHVMCSSFHTLCICPTDITLHRIPSSPFLAQDFSVAAPDHPITAKVLQGLGDLAIKTCRVSEAVSQLNNSVRVFTKFLGGFHPETLLSRSLLAVAYVHAASYGMARASLGVLEGDEGKQQGTTESATASSVFSFIAASSTATGPQATELFSSPTHSLPISPREPQSSAVLSLSPTPTRAAPSLPSALVPEGNMAALSFLAERSTPVVVQIQLNRAIVSEAFAEYTDAFVAIAAAGEAALSLVPRGLLMATLLTWRGHLELIMAQFSNCRETLQRATDILTPLTYPSPALCTLQLATARLALATSKFSDCFTALSAAESTINAMGGEAKQPALQISLLAIKTVLASTLADHPSALALTDASMMLVQRWFGDHHPDYAIAVHERSRVLHAQARFAEARRGHEAALKILESILPPTHPLIASVSQSVGMVLSAGIGFAEAEERYCRVMQLRGTRFGSVHPVVADTLASLAALERIQGHVEEALALLEQSLSIRRSAYGTENHIDVAASMTQLGELLALACKYQEARESFVDALAIQRRLLGDRKHPDIARSLLGIVGVQYSMGDYAASLTLVNEACEIRAAVLGTAHPDYANCLQHRARVLFVQGAYADALALHEQALSILEASLGPEHPDVATAAQHVGVSCQFVVTIAPTERFVQANAMLQKALSIRQARFGDTHPSVAETLGCLGSLRRSEGRLAEARQFLERALALRRRTQRMHMDVARSLLSLGNLLCQQGHFGEARLCYEEALSIVDQLLGVNANHPDVARILTGLAATKEAAGDLVGAQALLERALRIQQNCLGHQHRETSSTYHNLALVLRHQVWKHGEGDVGNIMLFLYGYITKG